MSACSVAGLAGALPAALWREARAQAPAAVQGRQEPQVITREILIAAETVIGLSFTDAEREMMLQGVNGALQGYAALRRVVLPNSVAPAVRFDPEMASAAPAPPPASRRPTRRPGRRRVVKPGSVDEVAWMPVADLGELIRTRQVSSEELTRLALDRLRRFDDRLKCVVTYTEDRALRQAREADREIARGRRRGPLHGIPWGAKDLLAVPGYPTTWGSPIYREQLLPETATVVERLDAAGAVLVAKLSLGELAQGDVWYGGMTRNPWNPEQGSSGSSAGPGSATAAGCVPFAIGSETLGSIVSPSTRNGVTGLRPTFGRVSRHGAMALSWTMDKLGPMARSAEDCGLVFAAIHGADRRDPTAVDRPFDWAPGQGIAGLRIGYLKSAFEAEHATKPFNDTALTVLRGIGADLVEVALPEDLPIGSLRIILSAEAAAAFDELTRTNEDDRMVRQVRGGWPNSFRQSRFIPAVEYIQANRVRTLLMRRLDELFRTVDVFVTPSFGGTVLLATNLTGHPAVVLPSGFTGEGTPVSLSFIGALHGEASLLSVAEAYQAATDFHRRRPGGFA
ncbi:MAG TPA: amidase [Gemmatimonadales bacterium]|nr:amidase [Gemmatimonadales bacterium]